MAKTVYGFQYQWAFIEIHIIFLVFIKTHLNISINTTLHWYICQRVTAKCMDMAEFSPIIRERIHFGNGYLYISTLGIEELRNLLFNKLTFQSVDSSTRLLIHWIIDNSVDKHYNRSVVPKISILNALIAGLSIKFFANIQSNHSDFQIFA